MREGRSGEFDRRYDAIAAYEEALVPELDRYMRAKTADGILRSEALMREVDVKKILISR